MSRYFYLGILIIAVTIIATFLFHKTPAVQPTAEFSGASLKIEYATTQQARERGLGGRESVPSDYGMLFVFPTDDRYGFWMKDMQVPIDIFWLNAQKRVVYIAASVATSTFPAVFYPNKPARYVLETSAGFGRAHNVQMGTPLLLKSP